MANNNIGYQILDDNSSYTYPQMKLPNHPSPVPENDLPLPDNLFESPVDPIKISDDNGMMEQIMYDQMYMDQVSNGSEAAVVNNGGNFVSQENHQSMLDFECFSGMLDDTGSWDSCAPTLTQPHEGSMFQDYELGYANV